MGHIKATIAALCIVLLSSTAVHAQAAGAEAAAMALRGYDTVAYFADGRAVMGSAEHQHVWDDARYQFASANHRATFIADPDRYAPQFGALCATGLSKGKEIEADPTIWRIVDGKLYIFSSAKAREMADKDPAMLERTRQAHLQKK